MTARPKTFPLHRAVLWICVLGCLAFGVWPTRSERMGQPVGGGGGDPAPPSGTGSGSGSGSGTGSGSGSGTGTGTGTGGARLHPD